MKKLTGSILISGSPSELSDLCYGSGFSAVDASVFLHGPKGSFLVLPVMELGRAEREVKEGVELLTAADLPITKKQRRSLSYWALGVLRYADTHRVTVSPGFPVGVADVLRRNGIKIVIAKKGLFPNRAIKSPEEVRKIQQSQRAAARAVERAVHVIHSSRIDSSGYLFHHGKRLTSGIIRHVIDEVLLSYDCVGTGTIVACGRRSADPHEHGQGPLRAGKPIVIDIFPKHRGHGYWGDITRTVVRGKASPELWQMFNAVKDAQLAAIRRVRAGVSVKKIHGVVIRTFDAHGFMTHMKNGKAEGFIHSTGHGVGLDIHEPPAVSASDNILRAGNVITIEPGLYYERWGGVRIEDTILVTRTGHVLLARASKRFEV